MDRHPSQSHLNYRPDIDGLRAIAVLSVVFCHAELGFTGGYVGVDVFFVISGYLITSLILKDLNQGKFSLSDFWERRIRRIAPALLAVTLATVLLGWYLLLPIRYRDLARSILALTFGASNFYFWKTTGYFAPAADEKPLLHTWSLAVEEQFYLLVPLFLILLARTKQLHRALPVLAATMVVSLGLSIYGAHLRDEATFYLLPSRAWELLSGSLLAFLALRGVNAPSRYGNLFATAGLVSILLPCILYTETTPFPGLAAVPPVIGAALLIWCGMQPSRTPFVNQVLASRPVVFVGLISYSLYLWHWPILTLTKSQFVLPLSVEARLGLVAISFLVAVASWRLIEVPFRRRQLLASRRALVLATSSSFLLLFGAGALLSLFRGFENRVPSAARNFAASSRIDPRYRPQVNRDDIPDRLPVFGRRDVPPALLVWGDSHAMAILPAVASLCEEKGLSASAATHSGTPPTLNYVSKEGFGLGNQTPSFNRAVLDYVRSRKLTAVVLAARWGRYFQDERFSAAFQGTIDELRRNDVSVYIVSDLEFPYDVPKALALYTWRGWDFSSLGLGAEVWASQRQGYSSLFATLAQEGVEVLDPIPVLQARVGSSKVLPYDSGGSFYRDRDHLSTYGALALKPLFAPLVAELAQERGHRQVGRGSVRSGPAGAQGELRGLWSLTR
jgi:peptidoglycan/LPS O-acetylase OafA/YrhL